MNMKQNKKFNIESGNMRAYSSGLLQGTAYNKLHVGLTSALAPFNIYIPEWKLLGQLHENGKIRLSELATLLSYDPPMVTKLAKGLEKKKLLKREYDKQDERAKLIVNTAAGNALIEEIEPIVKKQMRIALKGVNPEELKTYLKVLNTIVENAGN